MSTCYFYSIAFFEKIFTKESLTNEYKKEKRREKEEKERKKKKIYYSILRLYLRTNLSV